MSEIRFNINDDDISIESIINDTTNTKPINDSAYVEDREVKLSKISDERREELKKKLGYVIIQDFNDDYNLSEKEREKKNKFYKVFSNYNRCKKKYKTLPEFINAMRLALDCLDEVSLNNGLYNPIDFSKKVLAGKINISGLNFPKYIGKDKKYINWDCVWEAVINKSVDPKEFTSLKQQDIDFDDNNDIYDYNPKPNGHVVNYDESCYGDNDEFIEELSDSEIKKLAKSHPEIFRLIVSNINNDKKRKSATFKTNAFAFSVTHENFSYIHEEDLKRGFKNKYGVPKFNGDLLTKKDYNKFMKELRNYEEYQLKKNYNGKMLSQDEIDDIETKNALDESGWNLKEFYNYKSEKSALKKAYKKEQDKTKDLKKKLLKIKKNKDKIKAARSGLISSSLTKEMKKSKKKFKKKG